MLQNEILEAFAIILTIAYVIIVVTIHVFVSDRASSD